MNLAFTRHFLKDYERLPRQVQARVDKALTHLLVNPRHPSLQVKKLKGYEHRWEGRVSLHYRFTFTIAADTYQLLRVGTHDILP